MATITWVILKHHKKADGTYNPKIRVSHKRTTAYMATSIFTPLVRFKRGSKSGTVTDGEIEDCLNGRVGELRKVLGLHPEVMESCQSAKEIIAFIERYLKRKNLEIDFIDFARKYIEPLPTCRSKTCARKRNGNAFISIPIISEVAPLVMKYRADEGDRVFNFSQKYRRNLDLNVALHRGLGVIGQTVGIKNLQFYSARHSFATIARNDCDVSMDDIALCLTHSSGHDITDCYVKPDFSRVDRVIRKVVDFVFKDGPKGSTGNRPIMRVVGGRMVDKDEGVA